MNTGIVWGVIIMLVSIGIGGLVFGTIQKATETSAAGTGTTYPLATLNSAFTDNTSGKPNYWDNYAEDTAANARNASGYVTVTSTENNVTKLDNGVWYQSMTVSAGYDEISSALVNFKYRVIDNDNAQTMTIRVKLWNGTDNTTIFLENVTRLESAEWTSVENDVSAYVTGAGTYTLYLRAEMQGIDLGGNHGCNLILGFDDTSLAVNAYGYSIAENIVGETGAAGSSIFPLIILMVTVAVFAAIIAVLKYLG